jgi:hypothetical protein
MTEERIDIENLKKPLKIDKKLKKKKNLRFNFKEVNPGIK